MREYLTDFERWSAAGKRVAMIQAASTGGLHRAARFRRRDEEILRRAKDRGWPERTNASQHAQQILADIKREFKKVEQDGSDPQRVELLKACLKHKDSIARIIRRG